MVSLELFAAGLAAVLLLTKQHAIPIWTILTGIALLSFLFIYRKKFTPKVKSWMHHFQQHIPHRRQDARKEAVTEQDARPSTERVKEMWFSPKLAGIGSAKESSADNPTFHKRSYPSPVQNGSYLNANATKKQRMQEGERSPPSASPLSSKCHSCGNHVTMPFRCKFCGLLFCDLHRLPESHDCSGLKRLRREGGR